MDSKFNFSIGLTRYWWIPMITGLICVAFGIWCFLNPVESIEVLAYCFCFGLLLSGVFDIFFAFGNRSANLNWGWSLALGLLELIVGGWLLALPATVLATGFVYAVGIWIIVVAVNSICEACAMYRFFGWSMLWMILALAVALILAAVFITNPLLGGVAVWLWLGLSLLTYGVCRIVLSLSLRSINRKQA